MTVQTVQTEKTQKNRLNEKIERNNRIVEEMKERAAKGFARGEKKHYLQSIADKYGIRVNSVQQLFYSRVHEKKVEQRHSVVESESTTALVEHNQTTKEVSTKTKEPALFSHPIYTLGECLTVRITNIWSHSIEVETMEAIVEKGEILRMDIDHAHLLKVGDLLKVKVQYYDQQKKRFLFTLDDSELFKTKTNQAFFALDEEEMAQALDEELNGAVERFNQGATRIVKEEDTTPTQINELDNQELERLFAYLKQEVGLPYISKEAKERFVFLYNEYSLFDISVSIVKVGINYQPDVSLMFAEMVEALLLGVEKTSR